MIRMTANEKTEKKSDAGVTGMAVCVPFVRSAPAPVPNFTAARPMRKLAQISIKEARPPIIRYAFI
jgi:hypothetical protein